MGYWSFAIVNGRLTEIHYDEKKNGDQAIQGHCYVKESEYHTKKEKGWIKKDTEKMRFSYRNKKYKFLGESLIRYSTDTTWLNR